MAKNKKQRRIPVPDAALVDDGAAMQTWMNSVVRPTERVVHFDYGGNERTGYHLVLVLTT